MTRTAMFTRVFTWTRRPPLPKIVVDTGVVDTEIFRVAADLYELGLVEGLTVRQ